jgi:CRP-like cAMP-binding protein
MVVEFIKQNPDVLFDLMSRVYKGIDGLETRLQYLMSGSAYTRIIIELIIQAKRFGTQVNKSLELNISESELAADTGMTRETISREMKILKEKHIIGLQNHKLIIYDLQKLEAELAQY